jgi:hypothetical protein
VLGPGVVSIGIGLSSGKLIVRPYITSQVGLVFLRAAVIGILTQFFLNMNINATGGDGRDSHYWLLALLEAVRASCSACARSSRMPEQGWRRAVLRC